MAKSFPQTGTAELLDLLSPLRSRRFHQRPLAPSPPSRSSSQLLPRSILSRPSARRPEPRPFLQSPGPDLARATRLASLRSYPLRQPYTGYADASRVPSSPGCLRLTENRRRNPPPNHRAVCRSPTFDRAHRLNGSGSFGRGLRKKTRAPAGPTVPRWEHASSRWEGPDGTWATRSPPFGFGSTSTKTSFSSFR